MTAGDSSVANKINSVITRLGKDVAVAKVAVQQAQLCYLHLRLKRNLCPECVI